MKTQSANEQICCSRQAACLVKFENDLENRSTSILCRDGGGSENLDGQVVIVGHNLVEIGLT